MELHEYDGVDGRPAYMACSGDVFDVTGVDFYAPGSGYHVFVGTDASVGLATMELDPSKWTASRDSLSLAETDTLHGWHQKFCSKYSIVGTLSTE